MIAKLHMEEARERAKGNKRQKTKRTKLYFCADENIESILCWEIIKEMSTFISIVNLRHIIYHTKLLSLQIVNGNKYLTRRRNDIVDAPNE